MATYRKDLEICQIFRIRELVKILQIVAVSGQRTKNDYNMHLIQCRTGHTGKSGDTRGTYDTIELVGFFSNFIGPERNFPKRKVAVTPALT